VNGRPLRVLLTNHQLGEPGGTEVNVRDWAIGLLRRGHRPVVYAPVLGRVADALRERSIPVVDDLANLTEAPDIIHGSHTPAIIESIMRFPHVPALQLCQSVGYPMSEPLFLPQVRRLVAVDENTRDYLASSGVAPGRIAAIHNAIDLRRIPSRAQPLSERPRSALIFTKNESHIPFVEEACRRAGIAVTTLGRSVGRVVLDPERELIEHDLVFATARSALEAIASGAATIVMDARGLAGMATRANAAHLRLHNYGARVLQEPVTVESVAAAIACYDPDDASALSASLRPVIDLERQLDAFEALYADVIADVRSAPTSTDELVAALGPVLHRFLPRYPGTDWPWQFDRADLLARIAELDATLARERGEATRLRDCPGGATPHSLSARLRPPFARHEGAAWRVALSLDTPLAALAALCDDTSQPRRSALRLLEDGKPLGPAHALHRTIIDDGGGRYSHWCDNALWFSTSDNSDPNTNGRVYSVEWTFLT
jgi:hypothetical protein